MSAARRILKGIPSGQYTRRSTRREDATAANISILAESLGVNPDNRLARTPLGRIEGDDGIVEG